MFRCPSRFFEGNRINMTEQNMIKNNVFFIGQRFNLNGR
jgi:hypothetical protein